MTKEEAKTLIGKVLWWSHQYRIAPRGGIEEPRYYRNWKRWERRLIAALTKGSKK